jgi:hypothetical protein
MIRSRRWFYAARTALIAIGLDLDRLIANHKRAALDFA